MGRKFISLDAKKCYNGSTGMKNSNSFALKSFVEQWLPRLIALSVFAYLIYSLIFKEDAFSILHIWALVIMLVFVLAPMVSWLKLFNFIEFSSKLNDINREQQETKREMNELKNQISTFVSMRVSPIQVVTVGDISNSKVLRELLDSTKAEIEAEKDTEYTRETFLRRAYGYRSRAYVLLLMTMVFQIAVREHRPHVPADYVKGNTMDEKIPEMIKRILDNGLDEVFPIRLIDEKGEGERSVITPEIVEGLKQINSLIDLSKKIETTEIQLPSRLDIDSMFDKIRNALSTIALSLEVVATNSIIYQHTMTNAIKALEKEIEQSDIEQRPMRFPPSNPD